MVNYFDGCLSYDDIQKTYKELVKKYHPDVYGSDGNKIMVDIHNQLDEMIKKLGKGRKNDLMTKKQIVEQSIIAVYPEQYVKLLYAANNLTPSQHYNPYTKVYFSGINLWTLEIAMLNNNFNSCNWSTFCQYRDNNIQILKGSKATLCTLAINKYKKDDDGNKISDGVYFKGYNLFNEAQTNKNILKLDNIA